MPLDVPVIASFLSGAGLLSLGVLAGVQLAAAVGALLVTGAFAVPLVDMVRRSA